MEQEQLFADVMAEVQRRLEHLSTGVAVGGYWPGWRRFSPLERAEDSSQALIVRLEPWAQVRLAYGMAADEAEQYLLNMLLLGKPVYLAPQALVYHQYRHMAPPVLYRQYVSAEEGLRQMGIRPLPHQQKQGQKQKRAASGKVLTEAEARSLVEQGTHNITLPRKVIITPLAADLLREKQITIIRED